MTGIQVKHGTIKQNRGIIPGRNDLGGNCPGEGGGNVRWENSMLLLLQNKFIISLCYMYFIYVYKYVLM